MAALAFAAYVATVAVVGHYTVPHFDDWRIFDDLFSSSVFQWIFEPQNGHRVPGTLALLYLDYTYFGGHMNLLAAASLACMGITVMVLARPLSFLDFRRDPIAVSCVAFGVILHCWAASRHDLAWGMNQGTLMAAMWTVLTMASLAVVIRRQQQDDARVTLPLLAAAITATAATYSQGLGFSCWAGVLVVAIVAPLPKRAIVAYAIAAATVLVLYMRGVEIPLYDTPDLYVMLLTQMPLRLLGFTATLIGMPVTTIFPIGETDDLRNIARIAGALGIGAYAAFTLHCAIRRTCTTPFHILAVGLSSTALAGGVMVALNRHFWPGHAMGLRFSTWSTLFWIGLIFALPALRKRMPSSPGWPALAGVTLLVLLSVLLVADLRVTHDKQAAQRSRLEYVATMHRLGIRFDSLAATTLVPMPERAYRVVDRMRRDHRGLFGSPRAWLPGSSIERDFTRVESSHCAGAVTYANVVQSRDGPIDLLGGWAKGRGSKLEQILVAGRSGIVEGLGIFVHRDGTYHRTELPPDDEPWAGFLKRGRSNAPFRVYALLDDGVSVCDLGVAFPAQP